MTNEELLAELKEKLETGDLHPDSLRALLPKDLELIPKEEGIEGSGSTQSGEDQPAPIFSLTRLLYVVGGIFITLGILYLVSQLWNDMSTLNRILISLGTGVVFAAVGSALMVSTPDRDLGNVFHVIGGFLIPGGALITLDELVSGIDTTWPVTLTIAMVFSFYVLLVLYHRRVVLNFFAFANGTALAYLLLDSVVPTANSDLYAYLTMIIGVSYVLYGYLYRNGWNDRLIPLLYLFGPLGFYGAGMSQVLDTGLMEYLYPFLAFGGLVLAVIYLKSRLVLLLSTLAVIGYIIYFTAEYFADSIGWPIALILLGFVVIGLGYLSITLNRKYILPDSKRS